MLFSYLKSINKVTILIVCFIYINLNSLYSQLNDYETTIVDSLTKIIKNPEKNLSTASAYVGLSEILYVNNIDTVIYLCSNAVIIVDKIFENADNIEKSTEIELKRIKAAALNNIGYVFDNRGGISKALEYYLKGLKLREEINDKTGIAESYNNIGAIYKNQGNYDKALDYYNKCYALWKTEGYKRGVAQILCNIGVIYDQQGDWGKALDYYNQSLKINEETGDKKGIADLLNNIGIIYSNFDNQEKALENYNKSLKIRKEIEDREGIAISLYTISKVEYDENRISKALNFAKQSLNLSIELGFPARVMSAAELLSKIYIKENNWKKAYEMYGLYINMRDSISNEEIRKDALKRQLQNEYEKKESEIKAEQDKKAIIAAEESRRQKLFLWLIASVALAVAFIAIIIYRTLRVTRKQKNVIEIQKTEVENQKHIVDEKQKEILDSINYAKYLQSAILPPQKLIQQYLTDFFILYIPKDIVAGDFYWFEVVQEKTVYIAVADCTGHGVPGSLVSVVCSNALNRAVKEFNITVPSKILDKVRELVIETFEKSENEVKDGMDISLIAIERLEDSDEKSSNLEFLESVNPRYKAQWAGANNPLYIVKTLSSSSSYKAEEEKIPNFMDFTNFQLYELKPDKMPVAIHVKMNEFTNHEFQLNYGDSIYLFTDGFPDQFGGNSGKKFMYKQFKELLSSIAKKPMQEQKEILNNVIKEWIGNCEQVDDITIFGLKI